MKLNVRGITETQHAAHEALITVTNGEWGRRVRAADVAHVMGTTPGVAGAALTALYLRGIVGAERHYHGTLYRVRIRRSLRGVTA
jgi:Mn-dependent DtxR family transcriptional regulator